MSATGRGGGGRQRGISLITVVFLLALLAILATSLATTSGVQSATFLMGLQGARAYAAAQAGLEYGIHQATEASPAVCAGATVLSFAEPGLDGFDVTVSCSSSSHGEGAVTLDVYLIESVATYGSEGFPDYATRRIRATVTTPPP